MIASMRQPLLTAAALSLALEFSAAFGKNLRLISRLASGFGARCVFPAGNVRP